MLWKTSFARIHLRHNKLFKGLKNSEFEFNNLQIFKKFNISQMNPKEVLHNTAISVQLTLIYIFSQIEPVTLKSVPAFKENYILLFSLVRGFF